MRNDIHNDICINKERLSYLTRKVLNMIHPGYGDEIEEKYKYE